MVMRNLNKRYLVDSLMILLNLSNSYSIVPYLIFFQYSRSVNTAIIIIINTFFIFFRFRKRVYIKYPLLIYLYILICSVNVLSSFMSNTGIALPWLYLLSNLSFYVILLNCYTEYRDLYSPSRSLWMIVRGYIWISAFCISMSLLLLVLMKIGLNPYQNEITSRMDLFLANSEQFDTRHYYPCNIAILIKSDLDIVKFPFFNEKGIVCGIYHEPHIITFMVFPALFVLFAYIKKISIKLFLFLIWALIMLMTTSTTNILSFLVCLFVFLAFNKVGRVALIPISAFLIFLILYIGIENTELFFIAEKMEGGSMDYSMETIDFAFSPKTLFGSNFMNNSYLQESLSNRRDVGYISFILNLIFLFFFIFNIFKALKSRTNEKRLIGIAALYFFLHSMKVAMVTYTLSMLIFIVFLLLVVNSIKYTNSDFNDKVAL